MLSVRVLSSPRRWVLSLLLVLAGGAAAAHAFAPPEGAPRESKAQADSAPQAAPAANSPVAVVPAARPGPQPDPIDGETDPNADFSAELPRIEPRSPADSLATFQLHSGFRLEQTAAEPLIVDPVAIDFDERGRLYAVCMRGYSEEAHEMIGEIRLLEDTNGDGKFDRSTVFASGLAWPTAIICYDGGVFVGDAPDIFYFKDEDGDGVSDTQKTVFTGFRKTNVQGLLNSFHWGLDNRIHGATSSSGGTVHSPLRNDEPIVLNGRDFAFDPRTLKLEATSGGAQHGMSFDDWGRKFVCSNSSHIEMVMFEDRYTKRNPYLAAPGPRRMIAVDGGQAEVFRISPVEPWRIVRTRLRMAKTVPGAVEGGGRAAGYFTGATGVSIYRGAAWPEEYRGQAFTGDVGSNIMHRKVLRPDSVGFQAVRVDEGREFLASEEIWFRPVQFANAPDGAFYVLDMYREVIEHPASLPPPIKKHLDLTSGRDRGRLYRIVPEGFQQPPLPQLHQASSAELVQSLSHPNGWHRDTAARLLYERQDAACVPLLRKAARESSSPLGRMHALYALDGQQALTADDLTPALADEHPRVREHAVRLSEKFANDAPALRTKLLALTGDDDLRVRYQLAFTLGELNDPARFAALAELARRDAGDSWVRLAILSSLAEGSDAFFAALAGDQGFRQTPAGSAMLGEVARQIGAARKPESWKALLTQLAALSTDDDALAAETLWQLGQGSGLGAEAFRNAVKAAHAPAVETLDQAVAAAVSQAQDAQRTPARRAAALKLLALGDFAQARGVLIGLLDSRHPNEVQTGAIQALGHFRQPEVAEAVLEAWPSLSPGVRQSALEVLFARGERLGQLLDAIESGEFRAADLDPLRIKALQTHRDAALRSRAMSLLANLQTPRRQEVVDAYRPSLALKGEVQRGAEIFKKQCSLCHRLNDVGFEIGPNLAAMRARGPEAILLNVLDPNREVNPQFVNYVLITTEGRTVTGLIASETSTSVTLRRGENQSDTVLRIHIDAMQNTGLSIMPEGLEKQIDQQQMADLLAFLMAENPNQPSKP